jgi:hypothetical protein
MAAVAYGQVDLAGDTRARAAMATSTPLLAPHRRFIIGDGKTALLDSAMGDRRCRGRGLAGLERPMADDRSTPLARMIAMMFQTGQWPQRFQTQLRSGLAV